jgi:hypothetical protein
MKLKIKTITFEHLLYLLAFGLALFVRFLNLGEAPLSDFEAAHALQSWYAVQGEPLHVDSNPGYFSLTTLLFELLPVSNVSARFWPALVGSLVVLAPFGFRRLITPIPALIAACGLALDPGMVAVSRLAGGPMMAIGFGVFTLVFLYNRKLIWAGISGGLALISGPAILTGLVGFLLAFAFGRYRRYPQISGRSKLEDVPSGPDRAKVIWGVLIAALTIILGSTLFARYPEGLAGFGGGMADYFQGWITRSSTPSFQPLISIVIYQPMAFIFAVISAARGWIRDQKLSRWLSIWALIAAFTTLLYPSKQVYDISWVLIPLWYLAAMEIPQFLGRPLFVLPAFGLGGAILLLSALFWLMSLTPAPLSVTWVILLVIPVMILLSTILVGLGWSWETAKNGAAWGLSAAIIFYILASLFGATQLQYNNPAELWTPPPGTVQAKLLGSTLEELALRKNGRSDFIDILSTVDKPSLRWVLRKYSDVKFVAILDQGVSPSVIITPEDSDGNADLSATMSYLGQDFVWSAIPGWSGSLPPERWKWVATRQAPIVYEKVILWARSDFFPDQTIGKSYDTSSSPGENEDVVLPSGSIE